MRQATYLLVVLLIIGSAATSGVIFVGTTSAAAPTLETNTPVQVVEGSSGTQITATDLNSSDPDGDTITYNVTTAVSNGTLFLDGTESGSEDGTRDGEQAVGTGTFTQADVDSGRLYYSHDGSESTSERFAFDVTDGNGSTVSGNTFDIDVTATDDPPTLTTSSAGTNYTASAGGFVVDDSLTVTDPDGGTVDGATVAIGSGFDANVDTLAVNSTAVSNAGLSSSYDSATGVLTFEGTAPANELQAVLRTVTYTYSGDATASTRDLDVSFTLGTDTDQNMEYLPATGHFYEYVSTAETFQDAEQKAGTRSYLGLSGYLTTITSEQEDTTVTELSDAAWIGASDRDEEGNWTWIAGPENGTSFWSGGSDGSVQNGLYASWDDNQPQDNRNENEDGVVIDKYGIPWHDDFIDKENSYIVEYGGLSGDPPVTAERTVTVDTDAPTVTTSSGGAEYTFTDGGFVVDDQLTVTSSDGEPINGATVAIGSGFDASEDTLAVNSTAVSDAGLTSSYDTSTGVLTLTGSASAAEMQTVLRTVTYTYSGESSAAARELDVSFALGTGGNVVFDPTTDHYYEHVSTSKSADNAKPAAANETHLGQTGYLATITSQREDDTIHNLTTAQAWIGGSDADSEGNWTWIAGPEKGEQFWSGGVSGNPVNGAYDGWYSGTAPNGGTNENHAEINYVQGEGWNDNNVNNGYIVEYGGLNGASSTTAQRNLTVDTDAPTVTTSSGPVTTTTASGGYLVDGNLTVDDPDGGTIDTATVSIGQGFDPSSDELSVNTTVAADRNLTSTYDDTTGVLILSANSSATATDEDFQAVLRTVTYNFTGTSTANESDRMVPIRFTLDANQEQVTAYDGHYYEYVSDSVSWNTARSEAENRSHLGLEGYLATLTSEQEDDAIHRQFSQEAWIGASDAETEGDWKWVSGPENGTLFWKGTEAGSAQNGEYAGWSDDEPNSLNADENYAEINRLSTGWNDQVENQGYLVEYGGLTADSAITAQRTVTIDTGAPNVSDVTIRRVDGGGVVTTGDTIEVSATVTDTSSIQSVIASAIAFDAGTVNLSDDGPNSSAADDVYSATFTVGSDPSEQTQSVTVTATDDAGNGGTPAGDLVYDSITVNPEGTTDFRTVKLPRSFENPVVIAKPLESTSSGDVAPNDLRGHTRIRNVQSTSFEIRVEEWSVQDDETHPAANVSYIVAEAGTTTLDDGTNVSAGTITLNQDDGFQSITFEESLSTPVAFTQPQTVNDTDAVSTRNTNIGSNGLDSKIEDDQGNGADGNPHGTETLGYIAIEQGDSVLGETGFTAGTQGNVDETLTSINFGGSYPAGFVAAMQTNSGGEQSYLRYDERTDIGVSVRIEEDPVDNSDSHISNTVGYLAWNASTQVTGTRSNELSVDTSAPQIDDLSASFTTGSPPVSAGDEFQVTATVTDAGSIDTVEADVTALDASSDTITLDDTDGDGTYEGTFVVGQNPDPTRAIAVTVTDSLRNNASATTIAGSQASWDHTVNGTVQTGTFAGNGSTVDPYIVDSLVDLQAINKNATTRAHNYRLGTDIDASATRSWNDGKGFAPVGAVNGRDSGEPFSGSLDGDGHTISNLAVDQRSTNTLGLVGELGSSGTIANVSLQNASINGNDQIGGIAGVSAGEITNVSVTGTVTGNNQIGGAVGEVTSDGTVRDTTAAVTVDGNYQIGGLIGDLEPSEVTTISRVTATGAVSGSNQDVGGLIGHADGSNGRISIVDAHAGGDVTEASGNNNDHVGGLIGELTGAGDLTNVSAAGTVRANGSEVGGLVGRLDHTTNGNYELETASATGTVTTDGKYVGGLVGRHRYAKAVTNASADGDVTTEGNHVGGLFGYSDSTEVNSASATGAVTTDGSQVGGLIGNFEGGIITNSTTTGNVESTSKGYVGGLVGYYDDNSGVDSLIENVSATGAVTGNDRYVGGLIGQSKTDDNDGTTITDAHAEGDVTEASGNNNDHVGGLIGEITSAGDITNVSATGAVDANGDEVGGLIGRLDHERDGYYDREVYSVDNASATGSVTTDGKYVGGLVGRHRFAKTVSHASATGDVTTDGNQVGGLIGKFRGSVIRDSTATGNVDGSSNGYVGGLVGYYRDRESRTDSRIDNVSADGDVTGSNRYVGGLIGKAQSDKDDHETTVADAHAIGNVTMTNADTNDYAGGLIGEITSAGDITNVSATGTVDANGDEVGGLIGRLDHEQDGYYDREVYSVDNASATGDVSTDGNYVGGLVGRHRFAEAVVNATATGDVTTDGNYAGGSFGYSRSASIANVSATGDVTTDGSQAGGLVGRLRGSTIKDSFATGDVESSSNGYVGGLVGYYRDRESRTDSLIQNVSAAGDIAGSNRYVGGLIGKAQSDDDDHDTTVTDAHATGNVTMTNADTNDYAGGLIGEITSAGDITNVSATGTVDANGDEVGGLIGRLDHELDGYYDREVYSVDNASATGNVTTDGKYVGGLVGRHRFAKAITNGSATGDVTTDGNQAGGLIGKFRGSIIRDSIAAGDVDSSSNGYVGGLVGYYRDQEARTDSLIENVSAAGDVTGSGQYVGGLIGRSYTDDDNHDTTVADAHATGNVTETSGDDTTDYVGGLIGEITSAGDITDVSATGTVDANGDEVGGLIGRLDHELDGYYDREVYSVDNASATGNVTTDGKYVGGLVGRHRYAKVIANASAAGDVATDGNQAGGLIGKLREGDIRDATASGDVESGSNGYVGGLIGYYYERNSGQSLGRLSASGDVTGDGEYVGGLIGRAYSGRGSDLNQAAATGTVRSTGDDVGGLVGRSTSFRVSEAYATGAVTGDTNVGGLVGYLTADTVTDAYTAGNVTGDQYTGGFIGRHDGSIETSYWDTTEPTVTEAGTVVTEQAIGRDRGSGGPTGLTTADMTTASAPDTMDGFDFTPDTGTWKTDSEIGYPVFQWQDVRDLSATSSVSGSVTAGDQVTVELTVTDKNGDSAAGEQIRNIAVESEFDGKLLTQGSATVDSSGILTLTVPENALQTADGNHTLTIDSPNFESTTADVSTTAAPAAAISIDVKPSGTPKGSLIQPAPAVAVTDEYGNPVHGESVTVSINKHETPLNGTTTVSTDAAGVAAFSNISPSESSGYTLTFELTSDSTVSTTSNPFLRVNPDGSARFETIASATEEAVDGDSIIVEAGTYNEPIAFSKNITIEAQGDVILENDSTVASPVGVNVTSPDGSPLSPTIRGLTVKGFQTGISQAASDETATETQTGGSDWAAINVTIEDSETGVEARQSTSNWSVDGLALTSISGTGVDATQSSGNWTVSGLTQMNGSAVAVNASDATGDWSLSDSTFENVSGRRGVVDASVTDETAGDWTIDNVTIDANGGTDVPAINVRIANGSEGGDWSVSNTSMSNTSVGVEASGADGDWSVTDATITDTETGVAASGASGNWSVTRTTVENSTTGLNASGASGDWSVSDSTVDNATTGVDASTATGDWSLAETSVSDAETGVDAVQTTGSWSVDQATVTNTTTGVDAGKSTGDWNLSGSTITEGRSKNATVVGVNAGNSTGDWRVTDSAITDAQSENGSVVGIDTAQNGPSAGNWTVSETTISDLTSDTDHVTGIDAAGSSGLWAVEGPEEGGADNQMLIANLRSNAADGDAGGINATDAVGGWTVEYSAINNVSATGTTGTPASYGVKAAGANRSWSMEDTTISQLSANRSVGRVTAIDAGSSSQASNWSISESSVDDLDASSSTAIRDNTNDPAHAPTLTGTAITNVASTDSSASVLDFDNNAGNFTVSNTNVTEITNTTALSASSTSGDWEFTQSLMSNLTGTAIRASNSTGNWKATRSSIANVNGMAVDANGSEGEWLMAFTDITDTTTGVSATDSTGDWTVRNTKISNVSTVAVSADNAAGNWSLSEGIVENTSSTAISNQGSSGGRILVFSSDEDLCETFGCISTRPVAGNQNGKILRSSVQKSATSAKLEDVDIRTTTSSGGQQIQVQLRNGKANVSAPLEKKYDLSRVGVDTETRLDLNLTVVGDKPRAVVGNGRDVEWSRQQNEDDTWDINITGKPAAIDYNLTANGTPPSSFPEGQQATLGAQSAMILQTKTLESENELTDADRERLDGAVFMTDAQEFGVLRYDSGFQQDTTEDDRVELTLKAPSVTADGANNTGYYTANIPQTLIDYWGVELDDIEGFIKPANDETAEPDATGATVKPNGQGGAVITFETHYSEIDVLVGPDIQLNSAVPDGEDSVDPEPPSIESGSGNEDGSEGVDSAGDDSGSDDDSSGTDEPETSNEAPDTDGPTNGEDEDSSDKPSVSDESSSSADSSGGSGGSSGAGGSGSGGAGGSGGGSGSGGGAGGAVGVLLASITAPVRWFGSLSTAGKAAVTVTGGAGAAGAAYSFGGDRIQTPTNMARRRLQSWLRRRLRGSTRQQLTRLVTSLRKRLAWSNIRARLAALRKYFTRSYWREWFENRRELATREGLQAFLIETYRSYRKRQWRGWLRGRLRGGVDAASGGLVTTLIPGWLAPVSGPVGAALSVVVAEIQRWIEDIVMGKFDALGKRYSTLMLRSSALLTATTDRLWYALSGENPPASNPSVSAIAGEHAAALREVGIESVDQLAAADPDHLVNTLETAPDVIDAWIEQAQQRGAKTDRPPIAETQNGKRIRQRLGWLTARIAAVSTVVGAYVTETVERCKRARTTGQQRASRRAAQAQSFVRRLTVQTAKQLDTTGSELQSIDGIGPAYCERLAEVRITTVKQLAASDPERLGTAIDVSPTRVREWVIQADQEQSVVSHLRRRIRVEIVRTEATVTGVRTANPVSLAAVGDTRAWAVLDTGEAVAVARLSAVGIESVQQLAAADPGRIAGAVGCDVDLATTWVGTAQRYREYVIHAPPERFNR